MVSEPHRVSPFWVKGVGTPWADAATLDLSPTTFRRRGFNSDTLTLRKGRRVLPRHRRWIHRECAPGRGLWGHQPLAATCRFESPPKGTTAKPLDGGVLTLGWTRAQVRGLVGGAAIPCRRASPRPLITAARSRVFLAGRRNEMTLGFGVARSAIVLFSWYSQTGVGWRSTAHGNRAHFRTRWARHLPAEAIAAVDRGDFFSGLDE
jgi:hypothetical protein